VTPLLCSLNALLCSATTSILEISTSVLKTKLFAEETYQFPKVSLNVWNGLWRLRNQNNQIWEVLLITSMATKRSTTLQLLRIDTLIPNIYHPLIFIYSIDLSYLIRTSNKFLANILILYFALFSIFEYKDVQFTIFLSLLMLDLKIKLFNELLPISI
jgi:hypothetical protein